MGKQACRLTRSGVHASWMKFDRVPCLRLVPAGSSHYRYILELKAKEKIVPSLNDFKAPLRHRSFTTDDLWLVAGG